jgi:hypothetical protein
MPVVNKPSLAQQRPGTASAVARRPVAQPQPEPKAETRSVPTRPAAPARPQPQPAQQQMATPQRPTPAAQLRDFLAQRPAPAVQRPAPAVQRPAPTRQAPETEAPEGGNAYTMQVNNVYLYWVKCDPENPVDNWDGSGKQWTVQVRVPLDRADDLEPYGKLKPVNKETQELEPFIDDNGEAWVWVELYQKAFTKAGKPLRAPEFVGMSREAIDPTTVGNGSLADIRIHCRPYVMRNPKNPAIILKQGTACSPSKIRVRELVEYVPGDDFDDYDDNGVEGATDPMNDDTSF